MVAEGWRSSVVSFFGTRRFFLLAQGAPFFWHKALLFWGRRKASFIWHKAFLSPFRYRCTSVNTSARRGGVKLDTRAMRRGGFDADGTVSGRVFSKPHLNELSKHTLQQPKYARIILRRIVPSRSFPTSLISHVMVNFRPPTRS